MLRKSSLFLLFFFFTFAANAQDSLQVEQKVLKVGVKTTPPFIIKSDDGKYAGISISLWEGIAEDLGYRYEYVEYDLEGLLNALKQDEIDVCINPLTVTSERVEAFNFTQPFFITNLAIAVDKSGQNKWLAFIKNFFSLRFFEAVLLLLVVLLVFGLLVWFFEKDKNKDEFGKGIKGLWDGLWWSAVTMTTVGYGDKSPQTTGGRIIALIWMFTAIIIISGFTASIASSLTVSQLESSIKNPRDLKKVNVAAVEASTGAEYMEKINVSYMGSENVSQALKRLSAGNVDAVVYDEPIMRYMNNELGFEKQISLLPYKFATQYYSFSVPKTSQLYDRLNPVLLKEINSVEWKVILQDYNLGE